MLFLDEAYSPVGTLIDQVRSVLSKRVLYLAVSIVKSTEWPVLQQMELGPSVSKVSLTARSWVRVTE